MGSGHNIPIKRHLKVLLLQYVEQLAYPYILLKGLVLDHRGLFIPGLTAEWVLRQNQS